MNDGWLHPSVLLRALAYKKEEHSADPTNHPSGESQHLPIRQEFEGQLSINQKQLPHNHSAVLQRSHNKSQMMCVERERLYCMTDFHTRPFFSEATRDCFGCQMGQAWQLQDFLFQSERSQALLCTHAKTTITFSLSI